MCRRKTCRSCGKPTWAGCGAHIEQVLGDVAPEHRCDCRSGGGGGGGGGESKPGWLARLLGG